MNRSLLNITRTAIAAVVLTMAAIVAPCAHAFAPETYTTQSVLSEGRWVKIKVEQSGLQLITKANLRSWGFSDPSKVAIYGYGGRRIDNVLSLDNYIDDLPRVAAELTDAGLVFYAAGPDTWVNSTGQYYHRENSPFTSYGYYFVHEGEGSADIPVTGVGEASNPSNTAHARVHIEKEERQAAESGPLFVGDDFRSTPTRTYTVKTPGRVDGQPVWSEIQFVHKHMGASARLEFALDGSGTVQGSSIDEVPATSDSHYVHASMLNTRKNLLPQSLDQFTLSLTYKPSRTVYLAALDYISVDYFRKLTMDDGGMVEFFTASSQLAFEGGDDIRIWDVTNPAAVEKVGASHADGRWQWSVSRTGMRSYVAWRPGASLPQPKVDNRIDNQNLHGDTDATDMIIFAPRALREQARRIASLHENYDSLAVRIVDPEQVYNEFSSGAADVSGLRRYLKMVYDRSVAAGRPLRYALILGRSTLDMRGISAASRRDKYITMPWYVVQQGRLSLSDNDGYGTDDFVAMLGDDSGSDLGLDDLTIAVGRIPMTSAADGADIVDKLYQYVQNTRKSGWKNRVMVLADDEDKGEHLRQAEGMVNNMLATPDMQHTIQKVYIDAYQRQNGTYPDARREMFASLDEGVALWLYCGHANDHAWTGDGMLTFSDLNSLYLRNYPFVLAATCDFLRWDGEAISGGELMYKERNGGAIGMISATRPVYISDNALFVASFGRHSLSRDSEGRYLTCGELYRRTKNDILNSRGEHLSNPNRLRFVLMGDPALRLSTPDNIVELLTINGEMVTPDSQLTIGALSNATITGRVVTPDRQIIPDFNGTVNFEIFDALTSVTTHAYGDGEEEVFDRMGDKLYAGSARVTDGFFTARLAMPSLIADNFREATMSMYASSTSGLEAVGVNRDFYVFGSEEPDSADVVDPVIESMVLNHANFQNGTTVNPSPMLMARVSDNVAINLSSAGIGQQMSVVLDDFTSYTDVSTYYSPAADGSASGTINYPLENLTEGAHTLTLRVFDTSGNSASQSIEFLVDENLAPQIFEVYTDVNPASTAANFYVRHDRPETVLQVAVTVYNLLGQPIWTSSIKGQSDMDVSTPVNWDLCDSSGRRVSRGIYLYRATISTGNGKFETAARRIAVTAR